MWFMNVVQMGDARRIMELVLQKPKRTSNVALDGDSEFLRVWECLRIFSHNKKIGPFDLQVVSICIEKRLEVFYTRDLSVVGFECGLGF